jgi:hypothetical protein
MNHTTSAITAAVLLFYTSFSFATTSFSLKGQHRLHGSYAGHLTLQEDSRGKIQVQRQVTYQNLRFDGLNVEEIWLGEGERIDGGLKARFQLKQADFINKLNGEKRTAEMFKSPVLVEYKTALAAGRVEISFGDYSEELVAPAAAQPLWRDERGAVPSFGESHPNLGRLGQVSLFLPVMRALDRHPFIAPYKDRPEYKSRMQYFVYDATDFAFLRANPGAIRIAGKVTDNISLYEASLRNAAYAPTLAQKAEFFGEEMSRRHINSLGLYSRARIGAEDQFLGHDFNIDAGLWTGMYAGSQAMRWLATRDPKALEEFKRSLKGTLLLMDLTGDPKEFARTAELKDGTPLTGFWRQAVAPYTNVRYAHNGNNDMVKGIFHSMAWAFIILEDNDPLMHEVREHALRLPQLRVNNMLKHARNKFFAQMIAALASRHEYYRREYIASYALTVAPQTELGIDAGFYYGGIADWSGINLGMVGTVTEVLLLKKLIAVMPNPVFEKQVLKSTRQKLMDTWGNYATARRDSLTLAAYTFGASDVFLQLPETAPKDWEKKELWDTSLEQAVWGLREVPMLRHYHEAHYDYRLKPDWCPSAWPVRPWKYFTESNDTLHYLQGAYNYPLFEGSAMFTDSLWGSAFTFTGGSNPGLRDGRFDYLHAYWALRLGGKFTDPGL